MRSVIRSAAGRLRTAGRRGALGALSALPTAQGARARFVAARQRLDDGGSFARLDRLAREMLARADAAHARGDGPAAVDWADKALQLLFHPTVHYGRELSPVRDTELSFLRPLRESVVGRLLTEQPDAERPARPGGPRVLVLAASSWTFVDRLIAALDARGGLEIRTVDLSELPEGVAPHRIGALQARYEYATTGRRQPVPTELREALEWADTVFFEWASYPFAWFSLLESTGKRTVVRLHSYEAFTPYPQLASFASVDRALFVSTPVRRLVEASAPRVLQAGDVSLLPNVHDFTPFGPEKEPGYERTLLQVGWSSPVKDVLYTLDVLERLRTVDPSWRLLLAGHEVTPEDARRSPWARAVREALERAGDAVEVLGFRTDMPAVYRRAGFILSTSRHESFHEAVAEGAASACLPVVRDWPEFRAWGGVGTLYPADWVVDAPSDAAVRIRAHADRGALDRARREARQQLLGSRDMEATVDGYLEAILGAKIGDRGRDDA